MQPGFREAFNAAYTDGLYRDYLRRLLEKTGAESGFRLAETPVFLTPELTGRLTGAAHGIVEQLVRPGVAERMKRAIPPEFDAPGMDPLPSLLQVDLAVVSLPDGSLAPKLIELQGFPSLSAFEVLQAEAWSEALQEVPGLPRGPWSPFFDGFTKETFLELFRRVVVGDRDPETVVLMDLHPEQQKTWIDFESTRRLLGVDPVCPTSVEKEGRKLFRRKGGRRVPIERIYNRIVFDELLAKRTPLPFDFRDDLDVTWAPHPNWYWTFSKYSLPLLDHPAVPRSTYVSELGGVPADLTARYVLKPLFSFAGGGVNVEPTAADLERIPEAERDGWCLQEKIVYEPCIRAVDGGGVKVEVRMMFYRPEGSREMTLALNLCRLSRGKMLGVDFNKDFTWVGSSVALSAPAV
ncbi:hypothetical protein FBQ97_02515 [Acidobacteria bacterium ACD]|nr:MAG: hypothetical protein EDX89_18980 [Acidobacteriota bacterium]MCE7957950.1 hypothetical protein [Acidobacteria bacterium ACB2]MDL1948674.1 hypothetical protein [Acidobacteria bacterium ACD]